MPSNCASHSNGEETFARATGAAQVLLRLFQERGLHTRQVGQVGEGRSLKAHRGRVGEV